ncbi:MAG: Mur ligase family protein, partial [Ardenticatenales bacterium]
DAIPPADTVPWPIVHDIPIALVTGTNGKSTTVRLVAAIARAAGRVAGVSTTDWVRVGDDVLDEGDWSGPGGARLALRDPRTEIAILECARGGMLRRGLAVTRSDVAAITNVAADHLGDFGIGTVAELADVKRIVARGAGRLVLNADDAVLVAGAEAAEGAGGAGGAVRAPGSAPTTWFSLDPQNDVVAASLARGGRAVVLDGGTLVLIDAGGQATGGVARTAVATVDEVPIAFGGAARHNVANALCAIGVADALGLPVGAMREGIMAFRSTHEDNPGRLNVFEIGGCTVVVDYAHNPHGMLALADVVNQLPGGRRIVLIGQAGDRSDDDLRDLAAATLTMAPTIVLVKELAALRRGRPLGEVPRVLVDALGVLGVPDDAIIRVDDEVDGTRRALALARAGDVIILPIHKQRDAVVAHLRALSEMGWRAGEAQPD